MASLTLRLLGTPGVMRERGTSEEHVAERAGMDDEAAPAHADTRLRGAVPLTRALQRGAT